MLARAVHPKGAGTPPPCLHALLNGESGERNERIDIERKRLSRNG